VNEQSCRRVGIFTLAAALFIASPFAIAESRAQERRPVKITPGERGAVVVRVWGVGRPPARALNAAQAEAAARNAAEIDAYSRVAYLLGRVDRSDGERIVSSFRGRFAGMHVESSERLPDGSVHTEVTITVPAGRVPELLERIDEYFGGIAPGGDAPPRAR
jgi:hypothetical protein